MILPFDEAAAQLQDCFDVAPEALERSLQILDLQHAALAADPPLRSLPEAAAIAALARLRAGEPVIPRARWPIEPTRVARLLRVMGDGMLPGSGLEEGAAEFAESALDAAQADDGSGVLKQAERLGFPPEATAALLREALKPEMLRLSLPFLPLVGQAPRGGRCPCCADAPCAGTQDRRACCRWCGTTWTWEPRNCASCGRTEWRSRPVERIARGMTLLQCASCGQTLRLFPVSADPLLLSMLAVLTSPLDLAVRVAAEAQPGSGFAVF